MDIIEQTTLSDLWELDRTSDYSIDPTRQYVQETADRFRKQFEASDNDFYNNQVFKNIWSKKVTYLGSKEQVNTIDKIKNGVFQGDHLTLNNNGVDGFVILLTVFPTTTVKILNTIFGCGWKGSTNWQAYSNVNTMLGIIARLSNSVEVLNVNDEKFTNIDNTSEAILSNEASKNNYKIDAVDPVLDTGVYIVRINKNANAEIKEIHHDVKKLFCNQWIYVVDYDAKLKLSREVLHTEGVMDSLKIIQYPGSTVEIETRDRGNQWRNVDILAYQNTKTVVNGSVLLKTNSSANFVDVHHKGGNGDSFIKYNSAIYDNNVSNFIGKVSVDKKAVGTKSIMNNKNLLVDNGAKAVSKPILNINTKEIECTHGCTTSKIPEEEIYYLESLGIDTSSAKTLIANGHVQL